MCTLKYILILFISLSIKSTDQTIRIITQMHVILNNVPFHYNDVIMSTMASQITGVSNVCSTVGSGVDHRIHRSSASLVFVRGIHRWPVNSSHKRPETRKMFPFDDVIILNADETPQFYLYPLSTYCFLQSTSMRISAGWQWVGQQTIDSLHMTNICTVKVQ